MFRFGDSSFFQETVTFSQHQVFRLESYHLVQRGKAFAQDLDASFSQDGAYVVTTISHDDGKEKRYTGKLDLPSDTYNGLIPIIGKNVDREAGRTVHIVAFTPKPLVVPLAFVPGGAAVEPGITRFTLKPKLNFVQRIGAAIHRTSDELWQIANRIEVARASLRQGAVDAHARLLQARLDLETVSRRR